MKDLILTSAVVIVMLSAMTAQGHVWALRVRTHEAEDAAAEAALAAVTVLADGAEDASGGGIRREDVMNAARDAAWEELRKKDLQVRMRQDGDTVFVHVKSGGLAAAAGYALVRDAGGAVRAHRVFHGIR